MIACDLLFLDKELGKAVSMAHDLAVRLSRWARKTQQCTERAREGALTEESA
ncbi:hypothetical protein [Streptomyces sp. NRRL S-646]|uniref:hypothetical protein n=1 Tax=Streptomyces sp. NRRL S-646 TaxID=1463917 RepID=UPI000AF1828C|nr:hypothetical protein [Streptomyces sp. NRRL S-646]